MLFIFRSNSLFSIIGLVLFAFLIRLSGIITIPQVPQSASTPFAEIIFSWLQQHVLFQAQSSVLATLLILVQAFLINYIVSSHEILYKNSMLPGLFFILLNSIYPVQLQLSSQVIANTFIILLLNRLCYLYEAPEPLFRVFDAGIWLGLGILFDYDLVFYFLFILLSVVYMTSFNLRYWMVALFGMLLPAYLLGTIFYLRGSLKEFLVSFQSSFVNRHINTEGLTLTESMVWIFLAVAFFLSLISIQSNYFRNKVKTRRTQLIVMLMFVFGLVSVFAENQGYVYGLCFLATSLSVLFSNYFVRTERIYFKEILFAGILLCIMYYQYFNT